MAVPTSPAATATTFFFILLCLLAFHFSALYVPPSHRALRRSSAPPLAPRDASDLVSHVTPFLGAANPGNMFPGPSHPFGMTKPGPDCPGSKNRGDAYSGYLPLGTQKQVSGISLLHMSGTGGSPKYGVVSQLPFRGQEPRDALEREKEDEGVVGWYKMAFKGGLTAELAASEKGAGIRYSGADGVVVDVAHILGSQRGMKEIAQRYVAGGIKVDTGRGRYEGWGTYEGGWNLAAPWTVYYCGEFDRKVERAEVVVDGVGLGVAGQVMEVGNSTRGVKAVFYFKGDATAEQKKKESEKEKKDREQKEREAKEREKKEREAKGQNKEKQNNKESPKEREERERKEKEKKENERKGREKQEREKKEKEKKEKEKEEKDQPLGEEKHQTDARIGVSFISVEQACKNLPSHPTTSFQSLVDKTRQAWSDSVLSKVATTESDPSKLQLLYSSIYGLFLVPSDRSGENPFWKTDKQSNPYYDDIFTLWDTFRAHTPLFHILQPDRYRGFINSLLDTYKHTGWLPDGRSSNFNGRTQGGSSADNVLADAFLKGVSGVNWTLAYEAVRKNAEVQPPPNNDAQAPDSSTAQGRGAIEEWKNAGFVSTNYTRSVTRAVEYAFNDFCVSQLAKDDADKDKYLGRSRQWRNHWDDRMEFQSVKGFVSPLPFPAIPQDPVQCGSCYWDAAYYQALPYEYSLFAPHDMKYLIELSGGDQKFVERLDLLFTEGVRPGGTDGMLFNPGNEPSFLSPYLYNFVPGYQWRTAEVVDRIISKYYNTTPQGLPGNSDAGAMQAWLLWGVFGLYPVTGTTTFLIGAPRIKDLTIDLGGGKKWKMNRAGEGPYVQSLKVNGKEWKNSWVTWGDVFKSGGSMEFEMGWERKDWDRDGERPLWGVAEKS